MAAKKKPVETGMKNPKVHVYLDKKGEWRWRAIARNGRILADSGEGYKSKTVAKNMVNKVGSFLMDAANPVFTKVNFQIDETPKKTRKKAAPKKAAAKKTVKKKAARKK